MPNIIVKIPSGVFDAKARATLVEGINAAAANAEQIPDDAKKRMLCWVIIEEIDEGCWTCGSNDLSSFLIPVFIQINLPIGVLDDTKREQYIAGIHLAINSALNMEKRRIVSSCIINEVKEGTWGVNGTIWKLRDFAEHAGFLHLQALVTK